MKNLLITSRDLNINDEKYFSVDSSWFNYFEEYNLILAPNNLRDSKDIYNSTNISAIILTGGGNIKHNKLDSSEQNPNRELVEEFLINKSKKNNIPLVGVCRGTQKILSIINDEIVFRRNTIEIKEEFELISLKEDLYKPVGNRTCYNNYSIENSESLKDNWEILVVDKNNNVQLIKHKKLKIICFMWHPERDKKDKEFILNFIN